MFRKFRLNADELLTTSQNIAEFWNVSTRPVSARGGLGCSVVDVEARVVLIEKFASVLPFTQACYAQWRALLLMHNIQGVAVHGARIVASMLSHGVSHLLTLNEADFKRYSGLTVLVP
jgi:hypothetical protein